MSGAPENRPVSDGLAAALACIVRVSQKYPEARDDLDPALAYLATLAESATPADSKLLELVRLEQQMVHEHPGNRREAIMARLAISRSWYFELRQRAVSCGLL